MMNDKCCNKIQDVLKSTEHKCFCEKTSAKEKNRTFTIDKRKAPKEQFCRIEVDNCLIKDGNIKKCDFVFVRCINNEHYFVELKGSDIKHAIKQLETTIKYFKQQADLKKKQIFAYIVSNRVPSNSNQQFNSMKKRFMKNIGAGLKIATKKLTMKL